MRCFIIKQTLLPGDIGNGLVEQQLARRRSFWLRGGKGGNSGRSLRLPLRAVPERIETGL